MPLLREKKEDGNNSIHKPSFFWLINNLLHSINPKKPDKQVLKLIQHKMA